MAEVFELKEAAYAYLKNRPALTDINLQVHEGEILSIIGANGSGKSTLLQLLCGLVFPSAGTVLYRGEALTEHALKDPEFNRNFRASIGYVFQNADAQLFCPTVMDELMFGPLQAGLSGEAAAARASEIAEMLRISDLADRPPYMLSGGEKKRVALGSVLTTNPDILIFDEPMNGLDPKTASFVIELIFTLNEAGKTVIIATHHLEMVNHFQSRVAVLSEKHTVEKTGPAASILADMELLIRTNLISAILHRHDGMVHKHVASEFLFHRHRH